MRHPNANNNTEPYRNACEVCRVLIARIRSPKTKDRDLALLVSEWREVEQMKREWRGLPRLVAHKLSELAAAKAALARNVTPRGQIDIEPEPTPPEPSTPPHSRDAGQPTQPADQPTTTAGNE